MIVVFPMLETGSAHLIEDGVIGKKGKLTAAAFNFGFRFFDQSAVVIEHSISSNPSRNPDSICESPIPLWPTLQDFQDREKREHTLSLLGY